MYRPSLVEKGLLVDLTEEGCRGGKSPRGATGQSTWIHPHPKPAAAKANIFQKGLKVPGLTARHWGSCRIKIKRTS